MNAISIVLVIIVAFFAGMEGILDEFQFHQPLVACTLIGIVCGQPVAGIILGGSLQMIAMGWANIGAIETIARPRRNRISVAIPREYASYSFRVIVVPIEDKPQPLKKPLPGFFNLRHRLSKEAVSELLAAQADFRKIEILQWGAIFMQGLRIAIPAAALCVVPAEVVSNLLNSMPAWLTEGMSIGGGMVVAVGYALVINMMATAEVWPFFFIGFALAAISNLTLIGLGIIAVAIAFIYLNLSEKGGSAAGGSAAGGSGDPLGDILNDY